MVEFFNHNLALGQNFKKKYSLLLDGLTQVQEMAIFPHHSWFCYCSVFASTEQTDRATNKTDRIAGQLNSLLLFTVNDSLHSKIHAQKDDHFQKLLYQRAAENSKINSGNGLSKKCLNVRQKLGTRSLSHTLILSLFHSLIHSLSTC